MLRMFVRKLVVNQSWKMDRHHEMAVLSNHFYQCPGHATLVRDRYLTPVVAGLL